MRACPGPLATLQQTPYESLPCSWKNQSKAEVNEIFT